MDYPEYAEIDEKEYKINTDYRVALACYEVINNEKIDDTIRALTVIGLLFDDYENIIDNETALLKASKFLTCNKQETNSMSEIDMDFEQDEEYISSSFMSDYQIDLENTNMHLWKYIALLNGLKEDSILNRIRDVRTYDISTITDIKTREKVIKAKKQVALKIKLNKEEQEVIDEFNSLFGDD